MRISVRSHLIAGVAVVAAGVIAIPPTVAAPTPTAMHVRHDDVRAMPRIDLAASVRSLIANPPSPEHFAAANAAIGRIDPAAAAAASTRRSAIAAAAVPAAAPVPLNAVSNGIDTAYQFIQKWVDYGVQLTDYVLQFIPYGYLISGQINIFYGSLIRPIADSVVYGLIDPVVKDPLNPASYVNGFINVAQASVNALINTGIAELNYFFGWLIPPLPPLPPRPLAVANTAQPEGAMTTLALDVESTSAMVPDATGDVPTATEKDQVPPTVVDADGSKTPAATTEVAGDLVTEPGEPTAPADTTAPGDDVQDAGADGTAGGSPTDTAAQPSADQGEGADQGKGSHEKVDHDTGNDKTPGTADKGRPEKSAHESDAPSKHDPANDASKANDAPKKDVEKKHTEKKGHEGKRPEKSGSDKSSEKNSGDKD